MKLSFPSSQYDEAVAAVCHGSVTEEQAHALNTLLRQDRDALDEYIRRVELHSRLASDPDLFAHTEFIAAQDAIPELSKVTPSPPRSQQPIVSLFQNRRTWLALAAGLALLATGWWSYRLWNLPEKEGVTSNSVALLNQTVNAAWNPSGPSPQQGEPLDPGTLRLESGLAQIVFYSGVRIAIQGPAELEVVSQNEAFVRMGRLTADVPPQASGFRIRTPMMGIETGGASFGVGVSPRQAELHVFRGSVEVQSAGDAAGRVLKEGRGAVIADSGPARYLRANPGEFASLSNLQSKSAVAEATRFDQWRSANRRIDELPSLLVHLDFDTHADSDWRLQNLSGRSGPVPDATIVGCQWSRGRWPEKRALEFQSVSDRVRMNVPGQFESLTLATWVRVQGLGRKINSLFMSDGFMAGTVHWFIRQDGVLGMTVIGADPMNFQVAASDRVISLDRFGLWMHLAVVLDGRGNRVVHYLNGAPITEKALRIEPPFRIGPAEIGNWNPTGFPGDDPFLIRNFSGAMDEFFIFDRALSDQEIESLYSEGELQPQTFRPEPAP